MTLGVTAGIAIYKACDLVRRLMERGCEVRVVMTGHAAKMVAPVTFQALSGNPVITDLFIGSGDPSIAHVELARWEELLLVAPATANALAKFARGIADDFLSTHYLASRGKIMLAPAMNGHMWRHPAVRENISILEGRGNRIIPPVSGLLACGEEDVGKLPEPAFIADAALALMRRGEEMKGLDVLVTAGPTREAIDPVRYISNRSSGRMGFALAEEAMWRGARVTLVSGPTSIPAPSGCNLVRVNTASEMEAAVREHFPGCHALVMAAAVADYTPEKPLGLKIKKGADSMVLTLKKTGDILKGLKGLKSGGQVVAGFAAETDNLEENARLKLAEKGLDLICANDVSRNGVGFDSENNSLLLIARRGALQKVGPATKRECAGAVWDRVILLMKRRGGEG